MPDQDRARLAEEAADIFMRLHIDPGNEAIQAERDAFLGRGALAREAWASVAKAWAGTRNAGRRGPKTPLILVFVILSSMAAMLAADPLRVLLLADYTTSQAPAAITLSSGDSTVLDGGSAMIDDTAATGAERRVRLLSGAAFFDVETGPSPFIVVLGDATVEVLGTAFEVNEAGDVMTVAVAKGTVEVRLDDTSHVLEAGDRLRWTDANAFAIERVAPDQIATWRSDRFKADGRTFAEAAAVIERRLSERVIVVADRIAETRVVGNLDLNRPRLALDTLAAAKDAIVVRVPLVATFVLPRP